MLVQIVETWHINNRVNLMLLDEISDAGMTSTLSTKGGRDVARQFAHVHNVRLSWLEVSAKDLAKGVTKLDSKKIYSRADLKRHLTTSADAIATWLERGIEAGGTLKGFKRGVVPALGYLLAHEGHHRGSILLTLKQCGHKVSTETQYGIWDWNKI
ncbi:MAG TPA: DinB family protein [Vicinamibacterales bacterium]|nr:DinB family protein [Vicinamibacterales bacterium]